MLHEDPYATYRVLRGEHPAYWNDRLRSWALSRHKDVLAALRDSMTFSSAKEHHDRRAARTSST